MSQHFLLDGLVSGLFFKHSNTFKFMFVKEIKSELYFQFFEMLIIFSCTLGDEIWTMADCYLKLYYKENSN